MSINTNLTEKIHELKTKKNIVILAHYYQRPEIQDLADYVGDSLGLAQKAENTNAAIIAFAGVVFMAETAKVLNPDKKVLLPDLNAGCSLADSCRYDDFAAFKVNYPDHVVVSYINCSVEIKTLSDIICTSGNAVNIVNSLPADAKIIFAPDKNLGNYVNQVTGRNMILWDGTCKVHDVLRMEKILELKASFPDAKIIAHPECKAIVLEMADFIGSTQQMISFVKNDAGKKYIVATESGIVHQMKKETVEKEFIIVPAEETCSCNDCEYMKLNTLEKLYHCMLYEQPEIVLEKEIIEKASKPIQRMLEISALKRNK